MALLEVSDLNIRFDGPKGRRHVVRDLSFRAHAGQTLAIVGESGSGKSLTALSLLRMVPRPARVTGSIRFDGLDVLNLAERDIRALRGRSIAVIFQDSAASLNPVLSIGTQIAEILRTHEGLSRRAAWARAVDLLAQVGITSPALRARQYPHELSGGMCQRVTIAMALACSPRLVIADEATSALDPDNQNQILDLLDAFRARTGAAILMITHDFGVVAERADRAIVMYAGAKVEEATVADLFAAPRHPYTRALLAAVPKLFSARGSEPEGYLPEIPGQVPSLVEPVVGCAFVDRCSFHSDACAHEAPRPMRPRPGHLVACHHPVPAP